MLVEAGLEVSAGFLEGEVTACPLVIELGLWPLVGKTVPWEVSRGGWVLKKSLGSLSDVGWTYVPIQLVVWPEASQHWCLQAVGWGQVLVLMSQDAHCHQSQCWQSRMFPYVWNQCLFPQGKLQLPPFSPGDCLRPAGGSGPRFYQIIAFALGPGACEILCVPFKSEVFFFSGLKLNVEQN